MKSNQLPFFPVSGTNEGELYILLPDPIDAFAVADFLRSITNVYSICYIGSKKFFTLGTRIFYDISYLYIQPQPAFYGIAEEKLLLQVIADMWLYLDKEN